DRQKRLRLSASNAARCRLHRLARQVSSFPDHVLDSLRAYPGRGNDVTTAEKIETLNVCLGTYPHTRALKQGELTSDRVAFAFTEINPVNRAFMPMAREQKFDLSEMAIVTYLQAKAYNKPLVLMPATMMGRFQHGTMLYNSERGTLRPQDL